VIDGDSLELDGVRIRLHAIDAPEGKQSCSRNTVPWLCGAESASKLRTLVAGRAITCTKTDTDSYGRTVAICTNGESDIGAEMVSAGLALAYRRYGDDYVDEEDAARVAKRGLWAGEFTPPWDYRHDSAERSNAAPREPRDSAQQPSPPPAPQCRDPQIKGNISQRDGRRLYHVPGMPNYDETKIDPQHGERWFCTEPEARAAGWARAGG